VPAFQNPCASVHDDFMTFYTDSFYSPTDADQGEEAPGETASDISSEDGSDILFAREHSLLSTEAETGAVDVADVDAKKAVKSVSFFAVQIREYKRITVVHPDCSQDGPPLGIDWSFFQHSKVPIAYYETKKEDRRARRIAHRKAAGKDRPIRNIEMMVPRLKGVERMQLLHLDWGVPFQDIVDVQVEVKRLSHEREESNKQNLLSEKAEELWQIAHRKFRRFGGMVGAVPPSTEDYHAAMIANYTAKLSATNSTTDSAGSSSGTKDTSDSLPFLGVVKEIVAFGRKSSETSEAGHDSERTHRRRPSLQLAKVAVSPLLACAGGRKHADLL